ncbi:MAG: hypothetical protein IIC78_04120 [Chloroflexi bacterium]|nr:hypothetical protein [Chloroflexota bacterium]
MSNQRPRSVTWTTVGVLIFSASNMVRLILSLSLVPLQLTVPQWYISLTGAFWSAVGLWITYGLLFRKKWARKWILRVSLGYAVWYWLDKLFFVKADYVIATRLVSFALTILILGVIRHIMQRSIPKAYFMETTQ